MPSVSHVPGHAPAARAVTSAERPRGRPRRLPAGKSPQQLGAPCGADLDQELVVLAVEQLGEREVVAAGGTRSGAHRRAEAGAGGLAAVDDDDEHVLATVA